MGTQSAVSDEVSSHCISSWRPIFGSFLTQVTPGPYLPYKIYVSFPQPRNSVLTSLKKSYFRQPNREEYTRKLVSGGRDRWQWRWRWGPWKAVPPWKAPIAGHHPVKDLEGSSKSKEADSTSLEDALLYYSVGMIETVTSWAISSPLFPSFSFLLLPFFFPGVLYRVETGSGYCYFQVGNGVGCSRGTAILIVSNPPCDYYLELVSKH